MSSGPRAIVVGHADFAVGIVSAVEQITGQGDQLIPISSAGHGTAGIEEMIRNALASSGVGIIFTDLPGGSATMAARRVQRGRPTLTVLTGTNLAVLLEFVQRGDTPSEEGARSALEKGKASMIVFQANGRDGD